jgi:tRNA 2-thiouridine synthesizing protein D
LNFAILVKAPPFSQQGALTAYHFCKAALAQGHSIVQIFFYQEGVRNALALQDSPADEFDLNKAWCELAGKYSIELLICSAAAQRRAVNAITPGFQIAGLGQLIAASTTADRFLEFGG